MCRGGNTPNAGKPRTHDLLIASSYKDKASCTKTLINHAIILFKLFYNV